MFRQLGASPKEKKKKKIDLLSHINDQSHHSVETPQPQTLKSNKTVQTWHLNSILHFPHWELLWGCVPSDATWMISFSFWAQTVKKKNNVAFLSGYISLFYKILKWESNSTTAILYFIYIHIRFIKYFYKTYSIGSFPHAEFFINAASVLSEKWLETTSQHASYSTVTLLILNSWLSFQFMSPIRTFTWNQGESASYQ